MAGPQKIIDTEAMKTAVARINTRLDNLAGIRVKAEGHLNHLAESFDAPSAREFHATMRSWDKQYDQVTNALGLVVKGLGGTANNSDQTESDNLVLSNKFSTSSQSLTLPI